MVRPGEIGAGETPATSGPGAGATPATPGGPGTQDTRATPAEQQEHAAERAARPAADGRDPIERWLDGMVRAMRLPGRDREEIREEIDVHVRERVRDLMLSGMDEARAVHCAISELGDAALLAQRYAHAAKSGRRFIMQLSLTAVLASAVAIGAWSIAGGGSARVAQEGQISGQTYAEAAPKEAAPAVDVTLKETTLADALAQLAGAAGKTLYVRWAELEPLGLTPESPIDHLPLTGVSLDDALGMLGEHLDAGWEFLDHRMGDRLLTVATRGYFDRRERRLHVFDIGQALTHATPEDIEQLLFEMVSPNDWDANGGEVAKLRIAADKLFVTAPPRILRKVEWVLAQLEQREAEEEQAAASRSVMVLVPVAASVATDLMEAMKERMRGEEAERMSDVAVMLDERTNSLLFQGPREQVDAAVRLAEEFDNRGANVSGAIGGDARTRGASGAGSSVMLVGASGDAMELMHALGRRVREQHADVLWGVSIEVEHASNMLRLHGPRDQVERAAQLAREIDVEVPAQ